LGSPSASLVSNGPAAVGGDFQRPFACAVPGGCWGSGNNDFGQLNMPPGTGAPLAAGDDHACGMVGPSGGRRYVRCWGLNDLGQAAPPPAVGAPTRGAATAVTAGGNHSCAIAAPSGAVVCWGGNGSGESSPPASVDGTSGTASAIAAGETHTCAMRTG